MSEQPSKGSQLLASGKELFSKLPKDLNSLRQQTTPLTYRHTETLKLQLYVRALKGVGTEFANLSRNSGLASKNLFEWSQEDAGQDVIDIFDRAAFLQYKISELEAKAATKIEESRILLKDVRNFENDLSNRRKNRATLATKLQTIKDKDSRGKNVDQIASLQTELTQADSEIATFESSFSALKRQKLHESFSLQFAAQKELGEKLAIVSSYGELLIEGMETDGIEGDYKGEERTARIKVELEHALSDWQPRAPPTLANNASSLDHSDTRSFGATHADQLSQLGTDEPTPASAPHSRSPSGSHVHFVPPLDTIPATPGTPGSLEPHQRSVPPLPAHQSPFDDPAPPLPPRHSSISSPSPSHNLNLSPTPQDLGAGFSPPQSAHGYPVPHPPVGVSPPQPTVAETGAPRVGKNGPSSGQLRPRSSQSAGGGVATNQAEDLTPLPPSVMQNPSSMPGSLPFDEAGWDGVSSSGQSSVGGGGGAAGNERLPGYGEGDEEALRANAEAERILAAEREGKRSTA
ncbi:uncharacterized protein JCM6883_001647 [Sporobolomyces salmoneus]|uniref:uncharacterized protein n=1 Tax=Sporobolomyces salmoneus TaxID=183962 RepID=UPI00317FE4AF